MVGTSKGMKALGAFPGFKHHTYLACQQSVENEGCSLCDLILHNGWESQRGFLYQDVVDMPIYLFAQRDDQENFDRRYKRGSSRELEASINQEVNDTTRLACGFMTTSHSEIPTPEEEWGWDNAVNLVVTATFGTSRITGSILSLLLRLNTCTVFEEEKRAGRVMLD